MFDATGKKAVKTLAEFGWDETAEALGLGVEDGHLYNAWAWGLELEDGDLYLEIAISLDGTGYRENELYRMDASDGSLIRCDIEVLNQGERRSLFTSGIFMLAGKSFAVLDDADWYRVIVQFDGQNVVDIVSDYYISATAGDKLFWLNYERNAIWTYDAETEEYTEHPIDGIPEDASRMRARSDELVYLECDDAILEINLETNQPKLFLDKATLGAADSLYPYMTGAFSPTHFYYIHENKIYGKDLSNGSVQLLVTESEEIDRWQMYVYGDKLFYYTVARVEGESRTVQTLKCVDLN